MTFFSERYAAALVAVDNWLAAAHPEVRRATALEIEYHRLGSSVGWWFPVADDKSVIIGVDNAFPYSLPKVAIHSDGFRQGPHNEKNARLCTFGDGAELDTNRPVSIIRAYLDKAMDLLASNEAGENIEDYDRDFEAYWARDFTSPSRVRFLLDTNQPSQLVYAEYGHDSVFLASTREAARQWVTAHPDANTRTTRGRAAFVRLEALPHPDRYPASLKDLYDWLGEASAAAIPIVDNLFAQQQQDAYCVLLAGPANATRVATGSIVAKRQSRSRRSKRGQRADVPRHLVRNSYAFGRAISHAVDDLRTRLRPGLYDALQGKHVVMIGCGSLGAGVARSVGQTGVGRLTLIDPDALTWANLGRHELGVSSVGEDKAIALASDLKSRLPNNVTIDSVPKGWVQAYEANKALLEGVDLVIATTGSWNAEVALNDFQRSGAIACPIIYGWMERRACAAHALLIGASGACLRCGFDASGLLLEPATRWGGPEKNYQCATLSSPYGAVELGIAQSLVGELSIDTLAGAAKPVSHRVWLGHKSQLAREGAAFSQFAVEWMGNRDGGGSMVAAPWRQSEGCTCH